MSVPAAGGAPKEAAKVDFAKGERQHKYPCALPGGTAVLVTMSTADTATFDEARILAFSLARGAGESWWRAVLSRAIRRDIFYMRMTERSWRSASPRIGLRC